MSKIDEKENNILSELELDFRLFSVFDELKPEIIQYQCNPASIIIVSKSDGSNQLDENSFSLLEKILAAIDIDLSNQSVLIVTDKGEQAHFRLLNKMFKFDKLIVFGFQANEIGLHINSKNYQTNTFGSKSVLFADTIEKIANTKDLKKALWAALQRDFK